MTNISPLDDFSADAEFDKKAKEATPDLGASASGIFAQLNPMMSLFILQPRAENPSSWFLPVLQHHNLKIVGDDGKQRPTSRICLRAAGLGPCAICDAYDKLSAGNAKEKKFAKEKLLPRKKVFLPVWWIPLTPVLGNMATTGRPSFTLVDFDSKTKTYEVSDTPSMKLLGVPASMKENASTVWDNLRSTIKTSGGASKFVGPDGIPLFIIANNQEQLARRYKEPRPLLMDFPKELRPTADTELINVIEELEFPTPIDVATVLEETYSGIISDLSVYRGDTAPAEPAAKPAAKAKRNVFIE